MAVYILTSDSFGEFLDYYWNLGSPDPDLRSTQQFQKGSLKFWCLKNKDRNLAHVFGVGHCCMTTGERLFQGSQQQIS